MIKKSASARWDGPIKEGKGTISTESGALADQPYGFGMRFEGLPGTNPEELIGAAHAGCFSMALSKELAEAGGENIGIDTKAVISLEKQEGGFTITRSQLTVHITGSGDEGAIRAAADAAKAGCPVSRVLNCEIGMDLTIG